MKITGIGNAIVDVICKVDDEFLAKNNLVKRKHYKQIPPKVEYSLSNKSENLCSVFKSIEDWSNENYSL